MGWEAGAAGATGATGAAGIFFVGICWDGLGLAGIFWEGLGYSGIGWDFPDIPDFGDFLEFCPKNEGIGRFFIREGGAGLCKFAVQSKILMNNAL